MSETTPVISAATPRRSWSRIVLIAVLALSLFGNAMALGAYLRLRELRESLVGRGTEAIALPEPMRQELRAALRERKTELEPALRDLALARRALIAAISAEPYDRATTEAAMTDFRADIDGLLSGAQVILLDYLDNR